MEKVGGREMEVGKGESDARRRVDGLVDRREGDQEGERERGGGWGGGKGAR